MMKEIKYKGNDLEGILYYLHSSDSLINYSKAIKATSSSNVVGREPSYAMDFTPTLSWYPNIRNQTGEYVQIEIKSWWIDIEGYSIQTSKCGPACSNPKNWGFSASKDGNKWTVREDYVDENKEMKDSCRSKYLPVKRKGIYKYFRIIVTGESDE